MSVSPALNQLEAFPYNKVSCSLGLKALSGPGHGSESAVVWKRRSL